MNGQRDYDYSGTVTSISAVNFIGTDIPYFTFALDGIEEEPKPDGVFYVDISRATSQAIVAVVCAAYSSKVKIRIRQDRAAPKQIVNWAQISNPPQ